MQIREGSAQIRAGSVQIGEGICKLGKGYANKGGEYADRGENMQIRDGICKLGWDMQIREAGKVQREKGVYANEGRGMQMRGRGQMWVVNYANEGH